MVLLNSNLSDSILKIHGRKSATEDAPPAIAFYQNTSGWNRGAIASSGGMFPAILLAVWRRWWIDLSGSQSDYQSKGRDLGSLWETKKKILELPGRRQSLSAADGSWVAAAIPQTIVWLKGSGFDLEFLSIYDLAPALMDCCHIRESEPSVTRDLKFSWERVWVEGDI